MKSKICCGCELRTGSIIALVVTLVLVLLSPFTSSINEYSVFTSREKSTYNDFDKILAIIFACIIIGITFYGVLKRKPSWLILYLSLCVIGFFISIFTPFLIINEKTISIDKKEIMIIDWIISYVFSIYTFIVIFKYYQELKNTINATQNGRIFSLPLAPKIDV